MDIKNYRKNFREKSTVTLMRNYQKYNAEFRAIARDEFKKRKVVGRRHIPKQAKKKWIQFKDKAISIESGNIYAVTSDKPVNVYSYVNLVSVNIPKWEEINENSSNTSNCSVTSISSNSSITNTTPVYLKACIGTNGTIGTTISGVGTLTIYGFKRKA